MLAGREKIHKHYQYRYHIYISTNVISIGTTAQFCGYVNVVPIIRREKLIKLGTSSISKLITTAQPLSAKVAYLIGTTLQKKFILWSSTTKFPGFGKNLYNSRILKALETLISARLNHKLPESDFKLGHRD